MNVADIDDICARLTALGGEPVDSAESAELVLVNTCTVRAKAEEKAYSYFGELKHANRSNRRPFIAAMGCVIPGNRDKIRERHRHVDLLIDYSDPDMVMDALMEAFPPLMDIAGTAAGGGQDPLLKAKMTFVTAIRGCNHGCSYCIVPMARGRQRDVPLERIVSEAKAHEAAGVPDICILGQNILAYGKVSGPGHPRFTGLMEALLAETGFPWITYLTSRPGDLTEEICERIIGNPRITPLLHLPLQSGDDGVLRDMLRGYDTAHYRKVAKAARRARPDLYLTTDVLVGFPTESEEAYLNTLRFVEEVGFDDAFMFAYSERPGTPAQQKYTGGPDRAERHARLERLIDLQRRLGAERNQRYIGQELDVIIEEKSGTGVVARTAFNKPVVLSSSSKPAGGYSRVIITGSKVSSFMGKEV